MNVMQALGVAAASLFMALTPPCNGGWRGGAGPTPAAQYRATQCEPMQRVGAEARRIPDALLLTRTAWL